VIWTLVRRGLAVGAIAGLLAGTQLIALYSDRFLA